MGAFSGFLLLPVMGPLWGFGFVLERLRDHIEAELHDEDRVFAQLIELNMCHNRGQLSDTEYAEQEAQLLERLSAMREVREEWEGGGDELLDANSEAFEEES